MTSRAAIHPGAWWLLAIALGVVASRGTNPWVSLGCIAVAVASVALAPADGGGWRAFRLYLWMAVLLIVFRTGYRILFSMGSSTAVLVTLPSITLPSWLGGFRLLGPVGVGAVLDGVYGGLKLAAMVTAVGMAACLAAPRRLLASLPGALYEMGTAVVVALTVIPQLAQSVTRVTRARRLRGGGQGRRHVLREVVIPVLSDAVERSMGLAAAMDARGFGRRSPVAAWVRRAGQVAMVTALLALGVGAYAMMDPTLPPALGAPMLVIGVGAAAGGLWVAGRGVVRSRYRPQPWGGIDWLVTACALALVLAVVAAGRLEPGVLEPGLAPAQLPRLPLPVAAALLLALLPALLARALAAPAPVRSPAPTTRHMAAPAATCHAATAPATSPVAATATRPAATGRDALPPSPDVSPAASHIPAPAAPGLGTASAAHAPAQGGACS